MGVRKELGYSERLIRRRRCQIKSSQARWSLPVGITGKATRGQSSQQGKTHPGEGGRTAAIVFRKEGVAEEAAEICSNVGQGVKLKTRFLWP